MNPPTRVLRILLRVAAAASLIGVAATAQPGAALAAACKNAPTSGTVDWTTGATWGGTAPIATDDVCLPAGTETVNVDNTLIAVAQQHHHWRWRETRRYRVSPMRPR